MTVLNDSEDRAFITAAISLDLRVGLEQRARENDRSMSAELRRALTEYLERGEKPDGSRSVLRVCELDVGDLAVTSSAACLPCPGPPR